MPSLNILIAGGGIAGSCAAFFLSSGGHSVTIIERSPTPRTSGQAVDIRGPSVSVVRKMGLEQTIKDHGTGEAALAFINDKGEVRAKFDATGDTSQQSFTSEFEILRADLARVFIKAAESRGVKIIYGERIEGLEETEKGMKVTYHFGREPETYDLVIAADGLTSKTRPLVFPDEDKDCIKSLGQYQAFFTIPNLSFNDKLARWCNFPGRRLAFTRPNKEGTTGVYLAVTQEYNDLREAMEKGVDEQRRVMRKYFEDAGWEAKTILEGMDQADDFYYLQIAQVKLPRWTKGRFALLGDAAYASSPISGQGTSIAIVGAYILAGEICKDTENLSTALEAYERLARPFIARAQKLPPGAPHVANPETKFGISILLGISSFVAWSGLYKLAFGGTGEPKEGEWKLPEYDFENGEKSVKI